jgi:hypothetical protein
MSSEQKVDADMASMSSGSGATGFAAREKTLEDAWAGENGTYTSVPY